MYNVELINFITKNKSKMIKMGRKFFKNDQAVEDCIQRLYLKLLTTDYGKVTNVRSFVLTALYSQFHNFQRMNRRYKYDNDVLEIANSENYAVIPNYEEEIDDKRIMINLHNNITLLPEAQKQAIYNRFDGKHSQTNTEKANYRHGMLKLKELMNA